MKKMMLVMIISIGAINSLAAASTVAYWRFEEGTPDENVSHTLASGVYEAAVEDYSGNGYELSAWSQDDNTGMKYSVVVPGAVVPQTGAANNISIRNAGGYPALFTNKDDAIRLITPTAFTIEVVFKLESGDYRTLVGRDSLGALKSDSSASVLYFQAMPGNVLAIKYCDVEGYLHEAISDSDIIETFDYTSDPDGTTVPWYSAAAICDGSTLSLYLANLDAGTGYKLIAQTDLTISESTNKALSAGTGSGTEWVAGNWTVGRGLYGGSHCDRAYGLIDEIRISDAALDLDYLLYSSRSCAWNPIPADESVNCGTAQDSSSVSVSLQWNTGLDLGTEQVNTKILKHSLYLSADQNATNDPNLFWVEDVPVTGTVGSVVLNDLNYDGLYYWRVIERIDNGTGTAYPEGDPNNLAGPIWTFGSLKSVPVIVQQPVAVRVDAGDTAIFTIQVTSISSVQYQWFKADGTEIDLANDNPVSEVSSDNTFTISNVQLSHEGYYYCKVTNEGGESSAQYSDVAALRIRRLVAHWPLSNSAQEATNSALDGEIVGDITWVDSPFGGAASFDAGEYIVVPADDCLEIYDVLTVSCLIRNPGSSSWESFVSKSGENDTGWMLRQYSGTSAALFTVRGTVGDDDPSGSIAVNDGNWHHIVGIYDSFTGKRYLYVDGIPDRVMNDSGIMNSTSDSVMFGRTSASWANYFSGEMAHVQIYNYALTENEVAQLYYSFINTSFCKEKPEFDLNDDCIVNLDDLATLASDWLTCGIYPDCY